MKFRTNPTYNGLRIGKIYHYLYGGTIRVLPKPPISTTDDNGWYVRPNTTHFFNGGENLVFGQFVTNDLHSRVGRKIWITASNLIK